MDSSLQKAIDHASVVSFDVFDTLIKRNCANPTDIFTITEKRFNRQNGDKITGFKKARIEAERYARTLEETGEINFDAIYDNLDFPHKDKLKQLELLCEEAYCVPNKRLKAIYDYCVEKEKTIVCISDMYLPSEEIRKILKNAGYQNVKKIYVSNEYKKTKRKGNLFDEALKDFSLKSSQLVHIGDSWRSDYLMPKMKGIKAFHFSRKIINVKYGKEVQKQEGLNIIGSVLNNTTEGGEDFYRFGYEVLGPFCVEFCLWIKKQMEEQGRTKLFFCARDMQLIKSIFTTLFPFYADDCQYLYISRRSIILPFLHVRNDWDGFLKFLAAVFLKKFTINDVLDWLMVEKKTFNISNSGFVPTPDTPIMLSDFKDSDDAKHWFYNDFYPSIKNRCEEQYNYLCGYMTSLTFNCNSSVLVDTGWAGTTQYFISQIFGKELFGAYIGLRSGKWKELNDSNSKAFVFDSIKGLNSEYSEDILIPAFATMFEKIISAQHGTTICYNKKNKYELGSCYVSHEVNQIQLGALTFANNIKYCINDIVPNERSVYFQSLMRIILAPTYKEACLLGDLVDENFHFSYFAKPDSVFYYARNPSKMLNDFFASSWKIGFLKRLFRISLPYFSFYKLGVRFRKSFFKRRNY